MSDYVAKEPLYIGRVLAHGPGAKVSAERVERYGWQDKVEKAPKKAAAHDTEKPAPKKRTAK